MSKLQSISEIDAMHIVKLDWTKILHWIHVWEGESRHTSLGMMKCVQTLLHLRSTSEKSKNNLTTHTWGWWNFSANWFFSLVFFLFTEVFTNVGFFQWAAFILDFFLLMEVILTTRVGILKGNVLRLQKWYFGLTFVLSIMKKSSNDCWTVKRNVQ